MFDQVPDQVRQDIECLERHGYLSDSFTVWGVRYDMRTLKGDEELAAAVVTKEYVETLAQAKSWAWANVALSVTAIDGNEEFCPRIAADPVEYARSRFRYLTSQYEWPLAERLFQHFVQLQGRYLAAREAVLDFPVLSPTPSEPGLGSLTDLGISPEDLAPEED